MVPYFVLNAGNSQTMHGATYFYVNSLVVHKVGSTVSRFVRVVLWVLAEKEGIVVIEKKSDKIQVGVAIDGVG